MDLQEFCGSDRKTGGKMTEKMKPCPFCGGEGEVMECFDVPSQDTYYVAKCYGGCCNMNSMYYERQEAIDDWNNRAPQDKRNNFDLR